MSQSTRKIGEPKSLDRGLNRKISLNAKSGVLGDTANDAVLRANVVPDATESRELLDLVLDEVSIWMPDTSGPDFFQMYFAHLRLLGDGG